MQLAKNISNQCFFIFVVSTIALYCPQDYYMMVSVQQLNLPKYLKLNIIKKWY